MRHRWALVPGIHREVSGEVAGDASAAMTHSNTDAWRARAVAGGRGIKLEAKNDERKGKKCARGCSKIGRGRRDCSQCSAVWAMMPLD